MLKSFIFRAPQLGHYRRFPQIYFSSESMLGSKNNAGGVRAMSNNSRLPKKSDFPPGTKFIIKEFNLPLVFVPNQGWFNWFGGTARLYDTRFLRVDNNWLAESFEEWLGVVEESMKNSGDWQL